MFAIDEHIHLLPAGTRKFKQRIIVKRDSKEFSKVLTAIPVINKGIKTFSGLYRYKMGE